MIAPAALTNVAAPHGADSGKTASVPFRFVTASYLTRIHNQTATNLRELLTGLDQSTDAAIFCHTFQTLGVHHFLTEGFSNDFAQWALASLNRPVLAEWLAGIDIREYVSLGAIRDDMKQLIANYCDTWPQHAETPAHEPFVFCESVEVTEPLGLEAATLAEFRICLESLDHSSLYFHLIFSRIRLQLRTNDFSEWLSRCLGLDDLARRINRVDIYTDTLDGIRDKMLRWIEMEPTL